MTNPVLTSERLMLRPLECEDVTEVYRAWMNDPEVTKHTESAGPHSLESIRAFVEQVLRDERNHFFAIVERETGRHVGNIKLGPVNALHGVGSIGIIIGERSCWGRGYATEAIRLLAAHALETLGLHKVTAGCYAVNKGAVRAFEKAGFAIEGVQREQCAFEHGRTDKVLLGLLKSRPE